MRKSKIRLLYLGKMSDLLQLGDHCIHLIDRDLAKLSEFGITAATKTEVKNLTTALKKYPDDHILKGTESIARTAYRKAEAEVRKGIRGIVVRVQNKYGTRSAEYRQFGTQGIAQKKYEQLKECAELVIKSAEDFLSELSSQGLTQVIIDDLAAKTITLEKCLLARTKAIKNRDLIAENRVKLANQLYNLIKSVFNSGKTCWANDSEARYKHYRIYPDKIRKSRKKKKAE